ncbi:MAG: hypothetical protein PUH10_05800 [Erysipelotrichaceae bacterium]|uniref:hypothetical protein n=1 Tax=Floccifex sp. TaxID=2815810 RepID=UPI002A758682|nr:hypothetical protein [Floccifex sp.]MDD7281486.1 hypothetical protein [Erysipelotrichaceae bacterium]MDY2957694.1 hypothetical protein [Floccifex sp.]
MDKNKNEVECYLRDVKQAIREKRYLVSSRDKNEQLFVDYNITEKMREEILLDLQVDDFCEAINNEHPKFSHEILYIFGKDVRLLPRFGTEEETVSLYIKFNKLENLYCIVISFHKQEYPLKYAFK